MGLNIGGNIKSIYLGGNIKEGYVGSHKVFSVGCGNVVHIGEHDYNFVQIGSLLWIDRNIVENYGSCYDSYDNEKYGKLYLDTDVFSSGVGVNDNFYSALFAKGNDGWRIPYDKDITDLLNNTKTGYSDYRDLKQNGNWKFNNGDNRFGFNLYPDSNNSQTSSFFALGSNSSVNPSRIRYFSFQDDWQGKSTASTQLDTTGKRKPIRFCKTA